MANNPEVVIMIDGVEHRVDKKIFRRIITAGASILERLKREEGNMFPKGDAAAIKFVRELQFTHMELI